MDKCPMCKGYGTYVNSFGQTRRCGTCKGIGEVTSATEVMNKLLGTPIDLGEAKRLIAGDVQARHGITQLARDEYTRALKDLRQGISWILLDNTAIKYSPERRQIRHSR